jgi:fucose 4-O-acetylase-like acetyltransferase
MIVVLMIFFITLGYLLVANHLTLNYYIDLVFFAIFFFLLGLLFKKYALFSKKAFIFATPIYCVFLDLVSIHQRVLIAFPTRTFGKWYIVILSSISGIMVLYVSSILLAKIKYINRFLIYIGNNTLSIFCLHFFIFKLLYVVYYLIGVIPISHLQELFPPDNVHWLPFSLLAIALSLGINYWIQKSGALSYLFLGQSKKG